MSYETLKWMQQYVSVLEGTYQHVLKQLRERMMRNRVSTFIFFLLISSFTSLSIAASKSDNLDVLLDLSGMKAQVNELPKLVKSGLQENAGGDDAIPPKQMDAIVKSIDKTVSPTVVLADIRQSLDQALTNDEVEALLTWYRSDLGKRITSAEAQASTAEAYQQMMSTAEQLMANKPRVETAQRLDDLMGATEAAMVMQKQSSSAIFSAMMSVMMPGQPVNMDAYQSQIAAMEPQMRQGVEQYVTVSLVYAHQSISDADLAKYETFLKKPATQKFNKAGMEGLGNGFEKVVTDWATDFASILKNDAQ